MDLEPRPRLAGDGDSFGQSFEPAPQVAHVDAPVAGGDPGQPDEFLGARERVRDVGQTARERERALLHRLCHERLHRLQLLFGRHALVVADHRGAHLPRAHVGDDVRSHPGELQPVQVPAQGGPVPLDGRCDHHRVVHRGAHHRPRGEMLPEDLGGDSLGRLAQRPGVHQQPVFRVGVHIDEPRGHHQSVGIDHPGGRRLFRPDVHDRVAGDGEVRAEPRAAGAVNDPRSADQQVDGWWSPVRSRAATGEQHRHECGRNPSNSSHLLVSSGVPPPCEQATVSIVKLLRGSRG